MPADAGCGRRPPPERRADAELDAEAALPAPSRRRARARAMARRSRSTRGRAEPLPGGGRCAGRADAFDDDEDIDAVDAIDAELFPIFEEEADELLPQLQSRLRDWAAPPGDATPPSACMRTLHTFKGGARLAGAMRLGEMAHRLETAIEHLAARDRCAAADVEPLLARADAHGVGLRRPAQAGARPAAAGSRAAAVAADRWRRCRAAPSRSRSAGRRRAAAADAAARRQPSAPPSRGRAQRRAAAAAPAAALPAHRLARFATPRRCRGRGAAAVAPAPVSIAAVRVRAPLLDRLVNQAGEVSITRARIDADVRQLQGSLVDLTDSLDRMRRQLRDIELQAETQISSRMEAAKAAVADLRPAGDGPLHALPGTDAHDGRVGQRRRHACSAACSARCSRPKTNWRRRRG